MDNLETDKAIRSFRTALEIFGSEPSGSEDHDGTVARLHWHLGRALTESSSLPDAISIIHKALAIAEEVAKKAPSVNNQRSLFVTYELMVEPLAGRETLNIGDPTAAAFYAGKTMAVAEALASGDRNNMQGHNDLGFAYQTMGEALRLTRPAIAERWYRKSISIAEEMAPRYPAGSLFHEALAYREEALAAVLVRPDQAMERLKLLQDANGTWKKVANASHGKVEYRLSLMRSYCRLSDAELAVNDLAKARQYANSSLRFFNEFEPNANNLLVLRDVGLCYESLGNVQRRIAMDQSSSPSERGDGEAAARDWYSKSADVWKEWNRRGAATPESELERHKIERLLRTR